MISNVSYALLDAAVIAGRGDEPATGSMTHARLLEEVAALGGVLRHLGVGPGVPVVVDLHDDVDAVVAALAVARLGGVVHSEDESGATVVVASSDSVVPVEGRLRLLRADDGSTAVEPDLDWQVLLRAGRTDPSPCAVLEPSSAYAPGASVDRVIAELAAATGQGGLYDAALLRRLLRV